MDEARLTSLFSTLGVEERKATLSSIVAALTRGLRAEERQEIVQAALAGNGADERLTGMVEH
ncbi:MAG TPA: hypothetical protein VN317_07725 [Candidatus Methanoperedens sp.]|nr:hypothetical protein [Candidatus Methanoperedens sp.]